MKVPCRKVGDFCIQGNFLYTREFFIYKGIFYIQGNFLYTREFFIYKGIFYIQGNFLYTRAGRDAHPTRESTRETTRGERYIKFILFRRKNIEKIIIY
jgi:hypothetical protein